MVKLYWWKIGRHWLRSTSGIGLAGGARHSRRLWPSVWGIANGLPGFNFCCNRCPTVNVLYGATITIYLAGSFWRHLCHHSSPQQHFQIAGRHRTKTGKQRQQCIEDAQKHITNHVYWLPNSLERLLAALTASIRAERRPNSSKQAIPEIVVPPGLVTRSFSTAGCIPVF